MEEIDEYENKSKIRINTRKTELAFCRIYCEAIRKLLDFRDEKNAMYLRRYFRVLHCYTDSWCRFRSFADENVNAMSGLLTDSLYYRISYIFRNSTLLSSAAAFHFRNVLRENSCLLQRLLQKKSVKICSLGGGSASDIVAIVAVLDTISQEKGAEFDVQVSVIDVDERWKNTCFTVLGCLERFYKATWKINFIKADLSQTFSPNVIRAIRDADIVNMEKFLSEYIRTERHLKDTFKEVCDSIQPTAMLFVLDCAQFNLIAACGGYTGELDNFHLLYEEINDLHTLEQVAVKKIFYLYHKLFNGNKSNTHLNIFVRVWIKEYSGRSATEDNKWNHTSDTHHEKYNPKQSYLNITSFNNWRSSFLNIKERSACGVCTEQMDDMHLYQEISRLEEAFVKNIFYLCHRIFNGRKRNGSLNKFIKLWINESCSKSIMVGNKYKYNLDKQSYLNTNSLISRKVSFFNVKEQREWNKKDISKIVLEHKQRRDQLLWRLIKTRKLVEFTKMTYLKQTRKEDNENNEILNVDNELKWQEYFIEKSMLSLIKKEIYCSSLSDLYFILKFKRGKKKI